MWYSKQQFVENFVNLNSAAETQILFLILDVRLKYEFNKILKKLFHIFLDDCKVKLNQIYNIERMLVQCLKTILLEYSQIKKLYRCNIY